MNDDFAKAMLKTLLDYGESKGWFTWEDTFQLRGKL